MEGVLESDDVVDESLFSGSADSASCCDVMEDAEARRGE